MVVAELPFVEVQREALGTDAVMLDELALRVAPEPLEPIDVHLAPTEVPSVIDLEVPVPTEGERVVRGPLVRVDERAALDPPERLIAQRLRTAVGDHTDLHVAVALEDAEHRRLVRRRAPLVARVAATARR